MQLYHQEMLSSFSPESDSFWVLLDGFFDCNDEAVGLVNLRNSSFEQVFFNITSHFGKDSSSKDYKRLKDFVSAKMKERQDSVPASLEQKLDFSAIEVSKRILV